MINPDLGVLLSAITVHAQQSAPPPIPRSEPPAPQGQPAATPVQESPIDRPPQLPDSYRLVWHDEFNGPKGAPPDSSRWKPWHPGKRRDAINVEDACRLDGEGHLVITTTRVEDADATPSTVEYHTGGVTTAGVRDFTHGYFECRCRFQTQPGHWSAFWMNSSEMGKHIGDPAVAGAEIDVIEYLATPKYKDKALHTIHWDGYGKDHKSKNLTLNVPGLGEGFHVVTVLWTPDEYVFCVDGRETGRIREGVSSHPEHLILSDEVGTWADRIQDAVLPDATVIDYVRVWQLHEE